jgi:hypothetical protein
MKFDYLANNKGAINEKYNVTSLLHIGEVVAQVTLV